MDDELVGIVSRRRIKMSFNLLFIPTLILSIVLFFLSQYVWNRLNSSKSKLVFFAFCLLFAIPGVLFVVYYFHVLDSCVWFYQFRSVLGTELLASGIGLSAGIIASLGKKVKLFSRPFILALLVITVSIPHLKPILAPLDYSALVDTREDIFFQQTSNATCGPACAATILAYYQMPVKEAEIAKDSYTYIGGTEIWYLVRALRNRGLTCEFKIQNKKPYTLPYPAIAGINIGAGHFITIVDKVNNEYIIGDPLVGKIVVDEDEIHQRVNFTGFFLEVKKP